jgi:hypothetical protein
MGLHWKYGALPGSGMHGSAGTARAWLGLHGFTDKKENQIFLIYKEIQNGAVAKSYMTNGVLIQYMGKYLRISSYIRRPFLIYDCATAPL